MNGHRFPYGPGLFCPVSECLNESLANRYRFAKRVVESVPNRQKFGELVPIRQLVWRIGTDFRTKWFTGISRQNSARKGKESCQYKIQKLFEKNILKVKSKMENFPRK